MKRRLALTAALLTVVACIPSGLAFAQAPREDSASGTGGTSSYTSFAFDIRSGPAGGDPIGTFVLDLPGLFHGESTAITCLSVSGNTATFAGTQISEGVLSFTHFKTTVVDNGPAGSGVDTFATNGYLSEQNCTSPEPGFFGTQTLTSGDILVVDAPLLPTSTDQCENGGWRDFGVFKNQGDCVSFVATGERNPPAGGQAATTQTFPTSQSEFTSGVRNQGWWSTTDFNEDINDNYIVSSSATSGTGGNAHRNFFTFDLSSACQAGRVTLELTRFDQSGPLTYSLFDVSTPAGTLNANNGTSQTIFTDLGTGTSFGSFFVANGARTDVLSFPLNAPGVAAFNAARGGFFSVGGSIPDDASFYLFGFSEGTGTQQLVATCLPTTTAECENGGWKSYGVFKNQGQCVSFVATGGKNPPASSP